MTQKATFQDIILKLQNFWAERGAVLWQPYYTQVGAGTMNPATFLRVLGPEPWNVAYVEPSVRPDDGRYGENPNRFQMHYQFQVILKPDPADPVHGASRRNSTSTRSRPSASTRASTTSASWKTTGSSPPSRPGAWAGKSGWTARRSPSSPTSSRSAAPPLDPVAVELTYGLERILIALNNAKAIWGEEWAPGVTYGEVRRQEEFEHSKYYFEIADVELHARRSSNASKPKPTPASRTDWSCPPTITCSNARTPSTSSTRAAPSASPSARATSAVCAGWPERLPKRIWSSAKSLNIRYFTRRKSEIGNRHM